MILCVSFGATAASDCPALEKTIMQGIQDANSCWEDQDCQTFDYGCPWQLAYCHRYLTGKDDGPAREAVLKKIEQYKLECVMPSPYLTEQCQRYDEVMKIKQCPADPILHCVNGRCVTQTEVLVQDATPGKDPYGSSRIIIPTLKTDEKQTETDDPVDR